MVGFQLFIKLMNVCELLSWWWQVAKLQFKKRSNSGEIVTTSLSSKRQDEGKDGFVLYYFDSHFFSVGDKGYVGPKQEPPQKWTEEWTGKWISKRNILPTKSYSPCYLTGTGQLLPSIFWIRGVGLRDSRLNL